MQKPVVSNSSSIIHLAKINKLDLLKEFFGEVLIPTAVYEECVTEGQGRSEISIIKQATWLRITPVANRNLVKLLSSEIDYGEAEALALALETQASLILLDDSDARGKARLFNLGITGVIGVLLRAKKLGKLLSLSEALDALEKTGFWLGAALRERLLIEAGEK